MTIDVLARRAGMTTRNIRAYQTRGILPSPRLVGRVAYYDSGHLARLKYVSQLLRRGFSLSVIHDLLSAQEEGRSVRDLLGFEKALTAPWSDEVPEHYPMSRLTELFPEIAHDDRLLERSVSLGLLVRKDDGYEAPSPTLIEVGAKLVASGMPLPVALDEYENLRTDLGRIARRFVTMFEDHVWEPFVQQGCPPERLNEVTETLQRLRPAASASVQAVLAQAMECEVEASTARQVARFTTAANPGTGKAAG
ncbi:MAG TPA: MerR family transcriptional regulator [Actinomycetota bacterium]|jgi:DNA-binding transcriptional MerR regulator